MYNFISSVFNLFIFLWEKERELTHSYEKSLYTNINLKKDQQHQNDIQNDITQRLRTDLRRSVGVTAAIQTVSLMRIKKPIALYLKVKYTHSYTG